MTIVNAITRHREQSCRAINGSVRVQAGLAVGGTVPGGQSDAPNSPFFFDDACEILGRFCRAWELQR